MRRTKTLLAVAVAIFVGSALPTVAQGGHWWWAGNQVVHIHKGHNPGMSIYNKATNGSWTAIEHARGDWSGRAWAMDLGNWNDNRADVIAWDGHWGNTGWSGLATPYNWDGWHASQMGVQINVSPCCSYADNAEYNGTRAIACQEIGHAIGGMNHQGPGCMGFGYFNWNENDAAQRSPSNHDIEHVNHLWNAWH